MSSLKPEDAVPDYSTLDDKQRKVLDDWVSSLSTNGSHDDMDIILTQGFNVFFAFDLIALVLHQAIQHCRQGSTIKHLHISHCNHNSTYPYNHIV